jgi:F-type H+-transporting ATPase subunit a
MEQFEVHAIVPLEIGGIDISFTNSSLWMCIVVVAISLFFTIAASSRSIVPSHMRSLAEISYNFIADMIRSAAGSDGLRLFANVFGLIPFIHAFTVTSHIIVTLTLALVVFTMVIVVGVLKHGFRFLKLFVPDVPWYMLPLLTLIEVISFLSRPLSLSVRLFANMLAGHIMLTVFGGFVVSLAAAGGALSFLSIAPMLGIIGVSALEFLVAFLQAYVFAILTCIYLNDALHLHEHH